MTTFDWAEAVQTLSDFGGEQRQFIIPKTGLPFFDALRLYGAIELYVGLQDEVTILDKGNAWIVIAPVRHRRLQETAKIVERTAELLNKAKLTKQQQLCLIQLEQAVLGGDWPLEPLRNVSSPLDNPDSVLKDGVRGTAASTYKGLETGFGKESKVAFVDALLALSGQKRTENIASISFLPVFEGSVDFSKVVSPLRAWVGIPNILCAQVLTLLALKTSLFAEGYAERLSAVVYNTNLDGRKFYNHSGIINVRSTALSRFSVQDHVKQGKFISHFYSVFRSLIRRAWKKEGRDYKATAEVEDALAYSYWLLQPDRPKYLSALITSVERQKMAVDQSIFEGYKSEKTRRQSYVKEIFEMSYGTWQGDHEAVRKFAKAVASGIYYARPADSKKSLQEQRKERQKNWYDEVTMLRSAPSAKAFIERAMILIEQGKRRNPFVGSDRSGEDFNPAQLLTLECIGQTRGEFETFRDLFRMYLVQESKPYKAEDDTTGDTVTTASEATTDEIEGDEE